MVKEDFKKEKQSQDKIKTLEELLNDTANLITYSDCLYSKAKNYEPKLENVNDIHQALKIDIDIKEKSKIKSKRESMSRT
jgi:hypothetical protein